jgi:4-hydroxy-2-oxoheptanedioate aldolase
MNDTLKGLSLSGNKPVVGFGICLGSVRIAEMVGGTAFDYAMVDLLHSHYTKESATDAIRSLSRARGPVPIGRVADNSPGQINDLLDAGAMGIIVPMVESREEATKAVEAAFYPPIGKRSKGSPAAVFYGNDYYARINSVLNLIVMIETPEAAAKADEILSVPGMTGCLIGAGDLSFIMQERGRETEFMETVRKTLTAGKRHGVAMGISVNSAEDLQTWWSEGADFFLVSHDMGILNSAIRSHEKKYTKLEVLPRT